MIETQEIHERFPELQWIENEMKWTLKGLQEHCSETTAQINNKWVPARPLNYRSVKQRIMEAWGVFTGRTDSFSWPEGQ